MCHTSEIVDGEWLIEARVSEVTRTSQLPLER